MLRTSLVGITRTLDARVQESRTVVPAAMHPAYVRGADAPATFDYGDLTNIPTINGVPLEGDLTLEDLGVTFAQTSDIDAMFA